MTVAAAWRSLARSDEVPRPADETAPRARTRPPLDPPDELLVDRVLAGNTEEFAVLVTRYQGALYRHAVAMVLDHDTARDMVQDVFLRAYRQLATCRDRSRFRAWLFQTLRNRCLDHLKESRRHDLPLGDTEPPAASGAPDAPLARRGMRAEIARALDALPAAQREAIVMRCVNDLSYEEMSDLLGTSVSALKMRVLRAREALSAALAGRV